MIIPSLKSTQYAVLRDDTPDDILCSLVMKGFFNFQQEIKDKDCVAYNTGNNVYMELAKRKKEAMVIELIDYQSSDFNRGNGYMNIDLNYKNKNNFNLLYVAIQNGCVDIVRKLMVTLPLSSFTEQIGVFDSIHYAAFSNQENVLCLLLDYFHTNGLNINSFKPGYSTHGLNIKRNATKRTPLMYAIDHKMIHAIQKIGELYPASMNTAVAYENCHVSPIMVAFAKKDVDTFDLLVKHGANSDGFDVKNILHLDLIDWVHVNAHKLVLKGFDTRNIEFKGGNVVKSSDCNAYADPECESKINTTIHEITREYNWYRRKHFLSVLMEGFFIESEQSKHTTEHPHPGSSIERLLSIKGIQEGIIKYI